MKDGHKFFSVVQMAKEVFVERTCIMTLVGREAMKTPQIS